MANSRLPDFLIVGPTKTATTSLQEYVSAHPDVFMSSIKETRFFDRFYDRGLEGYKKFFEGWQNEHAVGEASPTYSFLPFVATRIKKDLPEAKLIFSFRNPVDRAFSSWLMRTSRGVETVSFREALENNLRQREEINFTGEEGAGIWLKEQETLFSKNKLSIRTYIQEGLYSEQLHCYGNLFPGNQVKIIMTEDLKNNFEQTMSGIFSFLGVDEGFKNIQEKVHNSYSKNSLKMLFNLVGQDRVNAIKHAMPKGLQSVVRKFTHKAKSKPQISAEDRIFAYHIFKDDIVALEKLLHRDLSNWKIQ